MTKKIMTLLLGLCTVLTTYSQGYKYENKQAKDAAEKVLEMAGGRDAWKELKSIRLLAVNHFPGVELGTLFEVWVAFDKPGFMTRIMNHNFNRLRGFYGSGGWSIKENGEVSEFNEEKLMENKIIWEGAFGRNIWRIASGDPTLFLKWGDDRKLLFTNVDGEQTAWFELNEEGRPYKFGFATIPDALELSEFATYGKWRIPQKGTTPEGVKFETLYIRGSYESLEVPRKAPNDLSIYNPNTVF